MLTLCDVVVVEGCVCVCVEAGGWGVFRMNW